ncbi:Activin_recp domain-containing protein [Caenorhabditis elegans]|uniref:Activin_recp domain-containing protein n=1 Tax=Caenorhabditis elegans TaxID=6239 RepID=Q20539_CAEEL|nr:Activin_recp domain-containing protein [Caenorhabditis elegans]CCD71411.2 Activin_recp domain-containing protein [Caenorhabditis elegans]
MHSAKTIILLLSLPMAAVMASKISCFVGYQGLEVAAEGGFDYCHTTLRVSPPHIGTYGGYLQSERPLEEDKTPSINGQCYLRPIGGKPFMECVCYRNLCNQPTSYADFEDAFLANPNHQ